MHQYWWKLLVTIIIDTIIRLLAFSISLQSFLKSCFFPPESTSPALPASLQQVLSHPVYSKDLLTDRVCILWAVLIKLPVQILQTKVEHRASQCLHRDTALPGSLWQHIILLPSAGLSPLILWSLKSSALAFSSYWQHPLQLHENLTF